MATVSAFNGMMGEFLSQLRRTGDKLKLKDPGTLKIVQEILRQCNESSNPTQQRLVLEKFAKYTIPHRALVQAKDASGNFDSVQFKAFLDEVKDCELLSKIGLHLYWDDLPPQTQLGIWQFLNQLLMVAIAIKSIPEHMLGQIESMAQSLVGQQMSGNEQNMPTPADMAGMFGALSGGAPGGMPDLGALMGGGGPPGLGALMGSMMGGGAPHLPLPPHNDSHLETHSPNSP